MKGYDQQCWNTRQGYYRAKQKHSKLKTINVYLITAVKLKCIRKKYVELRTNVKSR